MNAGAFLFCVGSNDHYPGCYRSRFFLPRLLHCLWAFEEPHPPLIWSRSSHSTGKCQQINIPSCSQGCRVHFPCYHGEFTFKIHSTQHTNIYFGPHSPPDYSSLQHLQFPLAFQVITDDAFKSDKLHYYNDASIRCLVITAGYFLYDIIICTFRFHENGAAFLVHATLCSFAYWYAATSHKIHYYGCGFLMWELSTPLLYVRWVLLKAGKSDNKWMPTANAAFMGAFFACRILYGPGKKSILFGCC